MGEWESNRCRRCFNIVPDGPKCPICGATRDDFLPPSERHNLFARLSFYSSVVASLQWDAQAIDLGPDARAWQDMPNERRQRLTRLLAGFCVAEDAVAEHLRPFGDATDDTLLAWVLFLQRRDEVRHAEFFDRVGAEVLGLAGASAAERRAAARELTTPAILDLFETELPAMAGELAASRLQLEDGVSLYHMVIEGIVLSSAQQALLEDLEDGAMPGVSDGVHRVSLDERWHIGLGLRCLIEAQPSPDKIQELMGKVHEASEAWGDAVPQPIRDHVTQLTARRMSVSGLGGYADPELDPLQGLVS
ncbi:MAG: hypothetical protein J2O48_11510 [Solirubrobacterales bacterium]|nr:hypothetical protein [Solirubrobacterales bacterium]